MSDPEAVPDSDEDVARVSQTAFDATVSSRDPASLVAHLETLEGGQDVTAGLAALVRHAGGLINQRPNIVDQERRDALLDALRHYLEQRWPDIDLSDFDEAAELVRLAEQGHLRILSFRCRTSFAALPGDVRAAAVMTRMEAQLAELIAQSAAAHRSAGQITIPGDAGLTDEGGRPVSSNSVVSSMVASLGGTLKMEGHANRWFDRKRGWLVLPEMPRVGEHEIELAGQNEYLSMAWLRWERLHQTARYGDTKILVLTDGALPQGIPEEIERVYSREPSSFTLDFIANERTIDRESISSADLSSHVDLTRVAKGIDGAVSPAPQGWVSPEEVMNTLSLSEALGYPIAEDGQRHGGLTLLQWVRGYSTLAKWVAAQDRETSKLFRISEGELSGLLHRVSLTPGEASAFLDLASFGKSARDLFDSPIVRTKGDWFLVGPALTAPRLAKIIPSVLATRGIQLERKGDAFEERVRSFLADQGFEARKVKIDRLGAEYDYDVLMPWNGYIFHLECKNRSLSGNDPVRAHHYMQDMASSLTQVDRLRRALVRWPDILTDAFGPDAADKHVVHCILQNDTFCIPDGIDGVHVSDWSALTRFFADGWLGMKVEYRLEDGSRIRDKVKVAPLWSGDEPTPEDLIAQFESPSQFRVVEHHLRLHQVRFSLDETTAAVDTYPTREPSTLASMAEALGVSPQEVQARYDRAIAGLEEAKRQATSSRHAS